MGLSRSPSGRWPRAALLSSWLFLSRGPDPPAPGSSVSRPHRGQTTEEQGSAPTQSTTLPDPQTLARPHAPNLKFREKPKRHGSDPQPCPSHCNGATPSQKPPTGTGRTQRAVGLGLPAPLSDPPSKHHPWAWGPHKAFCLQPNPTSEGPREDARERCPKPASLRPLGLRANLSIRPPGSPGRPEHELSRESPAHTGPAGGDWPWPDLLTDSPKRRAGH